MDVSVALLPRTSDDEPAVLLDTAAGPVLMSFAEWENVVHRVSHLYVRWCDVRGISLEAASDRLAETDAVEALSAAGGEH